MSVLNWLIIPSWVYAGMNYTRGCVFTRLVSMWFVI